ncbi:DNA-cytosine methyltransferase [Gloeomargarita lithophora Alchichica-D10]|uniref:Cytosine-specific methyltransferase n=1 Tax=Gloeomargarita lithophora Alchichica-D10 TaxID=1188229 RepID=A0A1J0A9C6_9CYAN|nr:DNA (cytosine-5-)-methyltransferase [Gloeomargarita lithophora]APB32519.1 DNA-cytosine methyltransferase [Gloeomargarita lithophora Alchichica-D10]
MKIFRLGEMFSGPGGMGLGAKLASMTWEPLGWQIHHEWAIDNDAASCATYIQNLCPTEPHKVICADVQCLDMKALSKINAFAFGFPCNDFSLVGEKRGINGQFGALYQYGIHVLNQFEPDWFIAENVGGLQSANQGQTFRKILEDLQQAGSGYQLTAHLYNFADYGVPQMRQRIIIVGIKTCLNLKFLVPAPTHLNQHITARQALENPPILPGITNQEITKQSPSVVARLKHIRPGENAWTANIPPELRLNVKGATMSQIYKRLEPDKPAYTITGSGGGGTHVYHWQEHRALTNRERARLQTFPDDFTFYGSKESVRRQIGMAVPPLAAKVIIEAILKTFAGIAYSAITPKWQMAQASITGYKQLRLLEKRGIYVI